MMFILAHLVVPDSAWAMSPEVRTIIAAVARCAWLDEMDRENGCPENQIYCLDNAEAWRKWGGIIATVRFTHEPGRPMPLDPPEENDE